MAARMSASVLGCARMKRICTGRWSLACCTQVLRMTSRLAWACRSEGAEGRQTRASRQAGRQRGWLSRQSRAEGWAAAPGGARQGRGGGRQAGWPAASHICGAAARGDADEEADVALRALRREAHAAAATAAARLVLLAISAPSAPGGGGGLPGRLSRWVGQGPCSRQRPGRWQEVSASQGGGARPTTLAEAAIESCSRALPRPLACKCTLQRTGVVQRQLVPL